MLDSAAWKMPIADVETRTFRTPDGATITWHDTGGGKPAVVLANGLGGPFSAWRHQIEYLRDRYRLLSWDYRGLYGSSGAKPSRLDVPAHVDDLVQMLDEAGVAHAAFIGWSMGVQVALELYARDPARVTHLVLINGTYGRPFETLALPLAARVAPLVVRRARQFHRTGSRVLERVARWPETVVWLKRLGLIGNTLDEDLFREMADEFASLDLDVYFKVLSLLGEHDASHVLETIGVPTLVISGDRDTFTPRQVAQMMARRVPGGEILVVRGATHYTAVEYPELVNLRIEKFLREHDY